MKGHCQRLNESLRQRILWEEATILQTRTPAWTARLGSAQLVIFVVNSGMEKGRKVNCGLQVIVPDSLKSIVADVVC